MVTFTRLGSTLFSPSRGLDNGVNLISGFISDFEYFGRVNVRGESVSSMGSNEIIRAYNVLDETQER